MRDLRLPEGDSMTKFASLFIAVSFALGVSAAASAAETTAILTVQNGTVMTSQGGEFIPAATGQALSVGDRLMVTEKSAAMVRYSNDCVRQYSDPGVYVVEKDCTKRTLADDDMTNWTMIGAIGIGAAVLAAAVSGGDDDSTPVSR